METELLAILFGGAAFTLWALSSLLAMRLAGKLAGGKYMSMSRFVFILMAAATAATVSWTCARPPSFVEALGAALAAGIVFACLFILYMPFYFVIHTSLSMEALLLLEVSANGSLPKADLFARYASEGFAKKRLDRMALAGLVNRTSTGDYILTEKGKTVAGVFYSLKSFWKLLPGG